MTTTQTFTPHPGCADCEIEARKHLPPWEIMLNVMCPKIKRPRRTSLHTLATVLGHPDPLALAKELEKSGKVVGYVCPDVRTPIFYLKSLSTHPGMIDTRNASIWGKWSYPSQGCSSLKEFFEKNPYPKIKGFKRFANGTSAMEVPYEKDDYEYVRLLVRTLKEAGITPGIEEPNDKTGFEGTKYTIFDNKPAGEETKAEPVAAAVTVEPVAIPMAPVPPALSISFKSESRVVYRDARGRFVKGAEVGTQPTK